MKHSKLRLILVRHGESYSNIAEERRLNSHDEQLTDKGKRQAQEFISIAKKLNIDQIFSSDEDRAFNTAKIIAEKLGMKIRTIDLLREKSSGYFSGRKVDSIDWTEINKNLDFYNKKVPGGESVNEVLGRVNKFLNLLESEYGNILVVTHGSFMRILMGTVLKKDIKDTLLNTKIKNVDYYIISRDSSLNWVLENGDLN